MINVLQGDGSEDFPIIYVGQFIEEFASDAFDRARNENRPIYFEESGQVYIVFPDGHSACTENPNSNEIDPNLAKFILCRITRIQGVIIRLLQSSSQESFERGGGI